MTQKNGITAQRKRNTKLAMEVYRSENMDKLLTCTLVKCGEGFTVADAVVYLTKTNGEPIAHGIVAGYLTDLYEGGKLSRRASKPGAKSGSLIYAKKPSQALRMKWRTRENCMIGVIPDSRLGAAI